MESANPEPAPKVIVYACSGASNLGQLANQIALRLDRLGLAELACATEVGAEDGGVQSSDRPVLAISGCTSACCAAMLARNGVEVSRSVILAERGIAKAKHVLVDEDSSERVFGQVLAELAPFLEKP
ncbi:MAG: putative zinc-binding protein [Gaiellaceae bacterium]